MGSGVDSILYALAQRWAGESFLLTWVLLTLFANSVFALLSSYTFYTWCWPTQVSYEKWRRMSSPKFPTPEKVRDDIIQASRVICCATMCPTLAFWLYAKGVAGPITQYGSLGSPLEYDWRYNLFTFVLLWFGLDFWELAYHHIGHRFQCTWTWRHDRESFTPTMFSVCTDAFCRALPLALFPFVMPANLDVLFFVFVVLFCGASVNHQCGNAMQWPIAHSGNCFCAQCSQVKGFRTREQWAEVVVPDYTPLLSPSFWLRGKLAAILTGSTVADENFALKSK